MTSSRIVRGTKGRIFVIICGLLAIAGVVALYNNTRLQLEDVQKSNELCHQQQENLSTQLQVIFDYKQRLEKALKNEKAEHHQAKTSYEKRINQQKESCDKASNDAKLQYTSLQQHFNLLQTEFNDFKDDSGKMKKDNMNEINQLQSKLREVQEQFKKSENEYKNKIEHLKSQIAQFEDQKTKWENSFNNNENYKTLQEEMDKLRMENEKLKDGKSNPMPMFVQESTAKSFNEQVAVGSNEYRLKLDTEHEENNKNNDENNQVRAPKVDKPDNNSLPVLALPYQNQKNILSSSTKSSVKVSSANAGILPLKEPSVSPETVKKESSPKSKVDSGVLPQPAVKNAQKRLPEGVVPIPDKVFVDASKQSVQKALEEDKNDIPEEVNAVLPARYRNNIIAHENEQINKNDKDQKNEDTAQEVFDFPVNNDNLDGLKIHDKNEENKIDKHHIDELGLGQKEHIAHGNKAYEDYKDLGNAMLEEEDDDADYPNLRKDPAIRN